MRETEMAGSRQPGPIDAQGDPLSLHGGILAKAPPALPGPVTSVGLVAQGSGDIRGQFTFREWSSNEYRYVRASGELGVPGAVVTHRDTSAQRQVSAGTGEHAGHLIAIQFGAPGDGRNLGLQNPNMNTFAPRALQECFQGSGGSYHSLETSWSHLLNQNYKIHVTVTDKYLAGENRPYTRSVHWTETSPQGLITQRALEFVNFSSPQSREKLR